MASAQFINEGLREIAAFRAGAMLTFCGCLNRSQDCSRSRVPPDGGATLTLLRLLFLSRRRRVAALALRKLLFPSSLLSNGASHDGSLLAFEERIDRPAS